MRVEGLVEDEALLLVDFARLCIEELCGRRVNGRLLCVWIHFD